MPRGPRNIAHSGCYHIVQRGNARQIIFEESKDYSFFLHILNSYKEAYNYKIHAYCLMANHFHILLQTNDDLGDIMKRITQTYSIYYNKKYERSGHLFQGRYTSEIIENQDYYFNVIRYILQNPEKAGIGKTETYRWSSYQEYFTGGGITDVKLLYKLIGGKDNLKEFLRHKADKEFLDIKSFRCICDDDALKIINNKFGFISGTTLQSLSKDKRNEALAILKSEGLTIRQLERLTGIGRGIISRAKL